MKKIKVSKEIVRVWFDTILNPIYNGLIEVQFKLNKNEYNWYWAYKDFIEIKSMGENYDYRFYPNYEQLTQIEFPELIDLNNEYDKKRSDFNQNCIKLYDELIMSEDLNNLKILLVNEYSEKGKINQNDKDYLLCDESIKWIAGYLINQNTKLDFNNVYKVIWDEEYEKFFELLNSANFNVLNQNLKNSLQGFQLTTRNVLDKIKHKNMELSLKYGVPIVNQ